MIMSGINGFIASNGVQSREVVQKMNDRLAHRGPSSEAMWAEKEIALGYRGHSVINHPAASNQPTVSHCGRFVLVMDGEITNYEILKQQIQYSYQSTTHSELVLAAWSRYGAKCVELLHGMFALAIWDKQERTMTLVRDRMGVKPLYWSKNSSGFIFSSEVRGLVASNLISTSISESSLVDYLRYQTVQSPDTILSEVKMLPPATILQYQADKKEIILNKYWDICELKSLPTMDYSEVKKQVSQLFYQSVERNLVSDVPFGAFLSGGIDSSAVVGAMARNSSARVKTFNISFAEEAFSEAKYARYIAEQHNTDHHEIKLSPHQFLELLPDSLRAMDHPSGDGPNTWVVSKLTKEAGVDMALSGLGGDELFGGYSIFKRMASLHKFRSIWHLPVALRKGVGEVMKTVKPGVASSKMAALLTRPDYQFNPFYSVSRQVLMDEQISGLLHTSSLPNDLPVEWLNGMGWQEKNNPHLLSRVSIAEMSTYMQNVLLRDSDQMGMAHALELRVPFMDHQLIEFVLSLPDEMKYPSTPKKLLVDSLPELLPDYIVQRPKMGFVFPWSHWLKNELHSYADERMHHLAQWGVFNGKAVLALWDRFQQGDPQVTFSRIWPLVVLAEWRRGLLE